MTNIILPEEHQFGAKNISKTEWNIEVGLCRATNSNEHGGFCVHKDKDSLETCQLDCSETIGCAAAGFYDGSWCDLFFHSASAPSTCPDGYISYTGSALSESYAGAPGYPNAQCAIKVQPGVSVIATEKAMNVSNSTMNVSNSTMVPSIAPTMKDVGKVLIECKVGNIVPSASPTVNPTMEPSTDPTSSNPSATPSQSPSMKPSVAPSFAPTFTDPSVSPTMAPTTSTPTNGPTAEPTVNPTLNPTANPSGFPTTSYPTVQPTDAPSFSAPTSFPSSAPTTSIPSLTPTTSIPSSDPTTSNPTISPTSQPSAVEVFEVAEAKDGIFLILLCVGVGCTVVCCICCTIYFKPIFFGKTDCEENGKRNPELRKPLSPVNDVETKDDLHEMWTQPSVEIKITE